MPRFKVALPLRDQVSGRENADTREHCEACLPLCQLSVPWPTHHVTHLPAAGLLHAKRVLLILEERYTHPICNSGVFQDDIYTLIVKTVN